MHLSKWNGWTLHLGALVFGGWRYHRMSWVTRPEPDHSPSTKDIFRVLVVSQPCLLFFGGLHTAAYPIALSHPGASYRRCANATIRPPSIAEVKAMKVSRRWSLQIKGNIFGSSWKDSSLPGGVVPILFESPVEFHVGYLVLIRDGLFSGIFVEDPRGNRTRCTWVKKQDTNPDEMHHFFGETLEITIHLHCLFDPPQRWFPGRSQPSKNPWKKSHQPQAPFLGWPNLLQPTTHVGKLQQKFRYLTRHGDVHIKKLSFFLEVQRTTSGFIFQPLDIFNGKPLFVSREGFFFQEPHPKLLARHEANID